MRRALLIVLISGCGGTRATVGWPEEHWVVHEELGLGFALPAGWTDTIANRGVIASGPEGAPTYYTTIAVQAVAPERHAGFADLLDMAYAHPAISDVVTAPTVPCIVGDVLGVYYDVTFAVFDQRRHRAGVLLDLSPYVVDVSYVAPSALFAEHLEVLQRALDTLYIEPTG